MTQLISDFKIEGVTFVDNKSRVESDTRDLRFLSRNTTGQRFEFRIRSIELEEREIKRVMAFVSGVKRRNDTIEVYLPGFSDSDASPKALAASYDKGDYQLTLGNTVGVEVGDFFTLDGHEKAYQVEEVAGNTIACTPNLMVAHSAGTTVEFGAVIFTMRPRGRLQSFAVADGVNAANLELNLVEVWS